MNDLNLTDDQLDELHAAIWPDDVDISDDDCRKTCGRARAICVIQAILSRNWGGILKCQTDWKKCREACSD